MKFQQFILVIFLLQTVYGTDVIKETTETHDYIVVGSGNAGSTVASRLSENTKTTVLLLESGPEPQKENEIPLKAPLTSSKPSIVSNYVIEPNDNSCLSSPNGSCTFRTGNVLGGSNSVSYMYYARGSKADFDLWEKMGASGWNYDAVLPYFKKAEGIQIDSREIDSEYHGKYGNLTVTNPRYCTEIAEVFLGATREAGYRTLDFNGKKQGGFGKLQATIRDGYRCSVVKAYLEPARGRTNLKIITEALVTKIHIDETKTAKGVHYVKDGMTYYAKANKEVIVSAGVIETPKLLMLSGIGPKKHLDELNIKVVQDLPVGQNLQDHITVMGLVYEIDSCNVITTTELTNIREAIVCKYPDVLNGVRSAPTLIEAIGYLKTPYETIKGDYNDIQLSFSSTNRPATSSLFNENVREFFGKKSEVPAFTIVPLKLHPKSRGTVTLSSSNPYDPPIIAMNYLGDPDDLKALVYGMKEAHEITKTRAFAKYKPKLIGPAPGCEHCGFPSDKYFECIVKQLSFASSNGGGSCKMGNPRDPTTVVDPQLKVKGIYGLRVVDESISPVLVSASASANAIMIGEKAAQIIIHGEGSN